MLHPEEKLERVFTHMSYDGSHDQLYALLDRFWDSIKKLWAAETAYNKGMAKQMYDKTKFETLKSCLEPKT